MRIHTKPNLDQAILSEMGGKEKERFGSNPQFKRRLRVVGIAYMLIAVMFSFQNCGRISKTISDQEGLAITNLSGLGLRDQTAEVGDRVELVASFQNIPINSEFHWSKNGEPFGSTPDNVNFIASVTIADAGTYGVKVMAAGKIIGETGMRLTVIDPNAGGGAGGDNSDDNGDGGDSSDDNSGGEDNGGGDSGDSGGGDNGDGSGGDNNGSGSGSGGSMPDPPPPPNPPPVDPDEVLEAPSFSQQPRSQDVARGENISIVTYATGNPAPTYQWQKERVDIPGETGRTLRLNDIQEGDEGLYRVRATNSVGTTYSREVFIDVSEPQSQGCELDNIIIPPGRSAMTKCEGYCQGYKWVGYRTVYFCDMNSNLTVDEQRCGDSKRKSLSCLNPF